MKLSTIFKPIISESDWQDEHIRLTKQEITDWLASLKIRVYNITSIDGEFVINVENSVRLMANDLPLDDDDMCYLPYKFGHINGNFIIIGNGREKLRSLKNGPDTVDGNYVVAGLGLDNKGLEGITDKVNLQLDVRNNQLTSWEGLPSSCEQLLISGNKIVSFTGISKTWSGSLLLCDPIERGVLELLQVNGLETVKFASKFDGLHSAGGKGETAAEIINKHLMDSKDVFDMQSDFIDAGLADWVKK